MVAIGSVDELRSRGTSQLVVDAPQAPPGWTAAMPGVRLVSHEGGQTVVELDAGVDDQTVLRTALQTGPVRSFGYRRPSLAELFRHVVSQETPA
jgi:ABC-2 type transport system ATP-binding protein